MSLYNMLFGTNPFSSVLLQILGIEQGDVPRFRDCFLNEDGDIVIHTRTGGGNRDTYEIDGADQEEYNKEGPFNNDLRRIAGFKSDRDDDFDSTYADFVYAVPEASKPIIELLKSLGGVQNPQERWQGLLENLKKGDMNDPATQRAVAVGSMIVERITEAFKEPKGQDDGTKS